MLQKVLRVRNMYICFHGTINYFCLRRKQTRHIAQDKQHTGSTVDIIYLIYI